MCLYDESQTSPFQVYVEFLTTCQRGLPKAVRLAYTTNSSHTSNQLIHSHTHTNNTDALACTHPHLHTPTYTHMHSHGSTRFHAHPHTLTYTHTHLHAHTSLFSKFLSEHFFLLLSSFPTLRDNFKAFLSYLNPINLCLICFQLLFEFVLSVPNYLLPCQR